MTKIIRPLRGGQGTIPADYREKLGINVDTLLQISLIQGELRIKPVKAVDIVGGSPWIKELYELFEPVRKEAIEKDYTEEKINTAIEKAVVAIRTKHGKSSL